MIRSRGRDAEMMVALGADEQVLLDLLAEQGGLATVASQSRRRPGRASARSVHARNSQERPFLLIHRLNPLSSLPEPTRRPRIRATFRRRSNLKAEWSPRRSDPTPERPAEVLRIAHRTARPRDFRRCRSGAGPVRS